MELDELKRRLGPFCEAHYAADVSVTEVWLMPGHAGFNLMLHRRGKRHDPTWELTKNSIEPLLERALQLLGG
jgi:hypothetical protein